MKKLLAGIVIAVILTVAPASDALAHGCCYLTGVLDKYPVCHIENCELLEIHAHDNVNYYPHYYGDGHDYHGYCALSSCNIAGYHQHNGVYCFGHSLNNRGAYRYNTRGYRYR